MSIEDPGPRRRILATGLVMLVGFAAAKPGRSQPAKDDEYDQPKLDRTIVRYQNTPGPDGHYCGVCTNFIAPSSCRVVNGEVSPEGYCLSFAPVDVDFK